MPPRYAKKVDATQSAIVDALRKAGVQVWIIGQPVDLLYRWQGKWGLLECKPVKRNRNDQEKQDRFLASTGTPKVRTAESALQAVLGVTGSSTCTS